MSELRNIGLSLQSDYQYWLLECTKGQTILSSDWLEGMHRMEQTLDIHAYTSQLSEIGLSALAEPPYIDLGTELVAPTDTMPPDNPLGNRPNRDPALSFGQTRRERPHDKPTSVPASNVWDDKQGFEWENVRNSPQDGRQGDQIPPPGYLPKSPTNSAQSFQAHENSPLKPAPPIFRDIGQGAMDYPNTLPQNAGPLQTTTDQPRPNRDSGRGAPNQTNGEIPDTPWITALPNLTSESEKSTVTDGSTKIQIVPNQMPHGATMPRAPFQTTEPWDEAIGNNWAAAPQATDFSTIKGLAAFAEHFSAQPPPVAAPLPNNDPQPTKLPVALPPQEPPLDPEAILELIEQRIESAFRRFYG